MQDRARGQALIARVENTFNMRFEEGKNPDIEFMAHLWEPLRWIHTPLALYMAAEAVWAATGLLLRMLGFRPFMHPLVRTPIGLVAVECACVYKIAGWKGTFPPTSLLLTCRQGTLSLRDTALW